MNCFQETVETSESSEPFEEELDLTQILTSVTDTVSKDDDSMLFRNDFELSDIDEQFNLENTHTIQNPDDDVSHQDINDSFEDNEPCSGNSSQHSNNSDPEDEVMETMDKSFHNLSLHETPEMSPETLLATFGFEKFVVPPLLSRHPPPATGRDDDVMKIKEIMDDTITKMGYENDESTMRNRILSGPDHKIGKCMLSLINSDKKYERFLLEFPLLHLRKSKITILFSAYSEAGLVQLLQYMRDNDQTNWESLMSAQHIDTATRYVKRVSLSLHLAFMVVFARSLENKDLENYIYDLETLEPKEISEKWGEKFEEFLEKGSKKNATFALHRDMMTHCDEVIAIALAERLGGPAGHALLRAAVKRSLPFVFLNGASSYAPYCVKLLYHHQSAGRFYKNLKQTLYSTPFKTSKKNFACDTKRELDHLDAIKGFRSGSTVASATVRMSLIDSLNEIRFDKHGSKSTTNHDTDNLGWVLTEVDESHIFPTAGLILRQNGLSLDANDVPVNVYAKIPTALPVTILDDYSYETGTFLMLRNVAKEKLFQLSGEQEIQNRLNLTGQSELVSRAKRSKGVTIRRTVKSKIITYKSERQLKEQERKKIVAKETKIIECLSSENNACQALVKPDSSKPKVIKSIGMQRAIKDVLIQSLDTLNESHNINIRPDNLLQLNVPSVPKEVSLKVKMCITEFAGIKFKTGNLKTGKEYLHFVESTVIKGMTRLAPNASTIIICEEKYGYTPDDLKAGTREQRQEKTDKSVTHLKSVSSLLNDENFNKAALTKTLEGKTLISTYLAKNIDALSIDKQVELVIDSQLVESTCSCDIEMCMCSKFCTPLARKFETGKHFQAVQLTSIRQRKGEAEMSQLDWLLNLQHTLSEGDVALSLVTSGDVDAIYIHLFVISQFWERRQDNTFRFPVYIVLQKPQSKLDVYNITGVLEVFEKVYQDRQIGIKLAVALCMGGNDFVPKCYQISHGTILKLALQTEYRANLLNFEDNRLKMNMDVYVDFMKTLYCPKRIRSNTMSFSDVRAATIRKSADPVQQSGYKTADPRRWLPPESAVRNLGELIQLQIAYLETAGHHSAEMPNFLSSSCLKKTQTGEIENYFGPESHFSSVQDLPLPKKISSVLKRQQNVTPQKGHRKKRAMLTSTPKTKR